jgi:enoyl-CoA hydratase/carnithine racemase
MSKIRAAISKVKEGSKTVEVVKDGKLDILVMNGLDNRINMKFLTCMHNALDEIEDVDDARGRVLVSLSTHKKIFSNGLDFEHLNTNEEVKEALDSFGYLTHRFLSSQIPTVACVNGHAFAGGWFLSVMHHYRIMNSERGWICLNEVDLGIPVPTYLNGLGVQKIGRHNYWEASSMGFRYNAQEALDKNICQKIYKSDEILEKTEEFALELSERNIDPLAFQIQGQEVFKKTLKKLEKCRTREITLERIAALQETV